MNNVKTSRCESFADIVPYLYGELSRSDGSAFESHLLECGECTDEFASVSATRYELYEWKKLEFEPLDTPVFEIPYEEPIGFVAAASWAEKLRTAFNHSWATPATAAAGLAVVTLFAGAVFVLLDNDPDIASVNSETARPSASATVAEPARDPVSITSGESNHADASQPKAVKPKSVRNALHRRSLRNAGVPITPRNFQARVTPALSRAAPTLNEFADDEDTSLRLAQLFDDIDTSD